MKKAIFAVTLILGLAGVAWGQTPHQHAAVTVIDGSKNPELVPDSTAYRLVLLDLSFADNPSDEDKRRQAAHFRDVGLTPSEAIQFSAVLAEFRSAYNAWIARWNIAAEAADGKGVVFDPAPFLQQLEDLIQATRNTLKQNSTVDLKVAGYVQKHKANIQIHKGAAQ